MKWLSPTGSIQRTSDGRYLIMRATTDPEWWIAYAISVFGLSAQQLDQRNDAEQARECCEAHEAQLGAGIRA